MRIRIHLYRLEDGVVARREDLPYELWLGREADEVMARAEKLFGLRLDMINVLKPGESVMTWVSERKADRAFGAVA